MGRAVGREPAEPLRALAFGGDEAAPALLVGRHDRVHEPLEEVALGGLGGAPGGLEGLVRLEVRTGACE